VAFPYQVYQLTRSSLAVGLVSTTQLFPLVAGSLLGGSVVDAMDRRRLLMLAQVLMAACSAGLAVNADLGPALWPLFVLPALAAGFSGLDSAGRNAMVPNLVRRSEVSTANSIFRAGPRGHRRGHRLGAAITCFGLVSWLPLALLLLTAAGCADVISAVFRSTIIQLAVPDALRGRLAGLQIAVVTGGPRIGDLEAGAVATAFGNTVSVVSGGLACIAGALVLARLLPGFRRQRMEPAAAGSEPLGGGSG